jgi:flagellar operon protein
MPLEGIGSYQAVINPSLATPAQRTGGSTYAGRSFADVLYQRALEGVQLSRHAQKRVDRRDLNLDRGRLDRLDNAITRAAEKGAKNSVVMLDDLAVVVDVQQRTVVTAMQREGGRERVFTNIDSVVIA